MDAKNIKGAILITIVLFSMMLVMIGGFATFMIMQDIYQTKNLIYKIHAQFIAEAGVSRAIVTLLDSGFSAKDTPGNFPSTSFGSGTFDVDVAQSGTRVLLNSAGTFNNVIKTVTVEVKSLYPTAMNCALAAAGDIVMKSNQGDIVIKGDIHANGDMDLTEIGQPTAFNIQSWGSATGKATASGSYSKGAGVTVADAANSGGSKPLLTFPSFDFGYLKSVAQASGTYNPSGNETFNGASLSGGAAGIYYLEGKATFKGNCTITGGFVAGGEVTLNNGESITQVHDAGNRFPIFFSNDKIKSYGILNTSEGNIMYATNSVKIETPGGISTVLGTVLSGGWYDIVANGNLTLTYQSISIPELIDTGIEIVSWNK